MEGKSIFNVWKEVFGKPKYIIIALLLAILFYFLNVSILNMEYLRYTFGNSGLYSMLLSLIDYSFSIGKTIEWFSVISLIIISLLFGVLFSLISYKTNTTKETYGKVGFFATIGIFLGFLAPGCAACGVGLVSLFGISAATLSILPFNGFEVSILSIILLGYSTYSISKNISRGNVCEIKLPKDTHKGERRLNK